ncbi:leucine-rich repeat-containing G-protein coupled receptor 5-like isoform X2 [Archocentrus centrarchus]|uniref:leucine-rich repeat-containing G-protein coupled receptor 5-like isoform X2 n=1 Tax=Archocentrus centrarchus TaxID=63155 RepID=UPI0011EA30A1|nr:leucine-rich repeat-containing G-protein coupled receptor 5-like isoform X2 [Archocentrus centrarchus]
MMLLLLQTLTSLLLTGGGWARSTCPPPCNCEDVQKSQRVTCVEVGLRSVPAELSSVTSSLDLSGNELTELSAHDFARLHRLRELFLHNNRLRRVSSEAFHNLKKLRSLRLDANFLSRLPAASFRGLSSLCHLWLDENVLTEVPVAALRALTQLQALSLALNTISHVPDRAFASLDQLLVLHLHGNRIHSVGRRSFDGLKNLEMLDLSFNRIDRFPAAIRHLSHLRDLNLQNNYIPVLPENAFTGNPSLLSINIRNNPVHTVGHLPLRLLSDPLSLSRRGSIFSHFTERRKETPMLDVVPLCDQSVEPSSSSQMVSGDPTWRWSLGSAASCSSALRCASSSRWWRVSGRGLQACRLKYISISCSPVYLKLNFSHFLFFILQLCI